VRRLGKARVFREEMLRRSSSEDLVRRVSGKMPAQARQLTPSLASLGLAYKVLSTRELPGGTLVWLDVTPSARDLAGAGAAKDLQIGETGVVPRLLVKNRGDREVLLPSDLVVDGGKQARVVEQSVIIPAASEVEIPVRCVEAGRWKARDAQTAQSFAVTQSVSASSREYLTQMKKRSLKKNTGYGLDQQEVWTHVTSELDREDVRSGTSSYRAVIARRVRSLEQARALDVKAPPGANGVAVIRTVGANWIEAFPSTDHVDAAVTAFVADLMTAPPPEEADAKGSSGPATARAALAMSLAWAAEAIAVATPPGTKGESYAVDAQGIAGFVLVREERLAHLAVSVTF